jgi:hypothetical protein
LSSDIKEFTVETNTANVEQATGDMSGAQIDDIERRAKAQVADVTEKSAKTDDAEKRGAGSEAQVYGDLAMEALAPGAKILTSVAEFLDTRMSEKGHDAEATASGKPRTIDEFVDDAKKAPGAYRAPADAKVYNGLSPGRVSTKIEDKSEIVDRAGITAKSLNEQGKESLATWDVPDQKMASVKLARQMTVDMRYSNEKALDSVHVARQQHAATQYKINQIAPGMGLGSGPTIRPQDLLREAEMVQAEQAATT